MTWYYARNGSQHGPHSLAEIQALIADGTVSPATLVWEKGMAAWLAARETELRSLFPEDAPPPIPQDTPPPLSVSQAGHSAPPPKIEILRLFRDAIGYSQSVYIKVLVFFIPSLVVSILVALSGAEQLAGTTFLLLLLAYTCVYPYIGGASIFYVHQNLTQQGVTVADSMQKATERFAQLVLASVMLLGVLVAGFLCLIIPGIYLATRLSFIFYAIVIENRSALDAFSRSWQLTKGYWWQIFGGLFALTFPIGFVGGFIGGFLGAMFGNNLVISALMNGLVVVFTGPILAIYYVFLFMTLVNLEDRNSLRGKPTLLV